MDSALTLSIKLDYFIFAYPRLFYFKGWKQGGSVSAKYKKYGAQMNKSLLIYLMLTWMQRWLFVVLQGIMQFYWAKPAAVSCLSGSSCTSVRTYTQISNFKAQTKPHCCFPPFPSRNAKLSLSPHGLDSTLQNTLNNIIQCHFTQIHLECIKYFSPGCNAAQVNTTYTNLLSTRELSRWSVWRWNALLTGSGID